MGFFDNIGKGISDFSQTTIQKGKDAASIAKLNRMISSEESGMEKLFEQLGRFYFDRCSQALSDPDAPAQELEEQIKTCMDEIVDSQRKISEYQEEIRKLQGVVPCPQCGAGIPEGAAFCPECGTKMAVLETEEKAPQQAEKLFCMNCGAQLLSGAKFCMTCGTKVEQEEPEPQTEESPAEEPETVPDDMQ